MLGNSVRLFRIAGIDVGVHMSWLVIFGLVTWSLAVGVFPKVEGLEGQPATLYWILGAITALLLHGLVEFNMSIPAIPATLAIIAGACWSAANDQRQHRRDSSPRLVRT